MGVKDFPPRVQKYINQRMIREWGPSDDSRLSVTELLGCLRKSYLNRKHPLPADFKGNVAMFHGIVFDELYTHLYPRNQIRVTHRLPHDDIVISGRLDFIDDDGAVADWKTVEQMYYIEKDGAREEHISQVMFYCWCEAIPKGRLYYQTLRNCLRIDVNPTPEQLQLNLECLEALAKTFHEALKTNTIPSVKVKKDWECTYGKGEDVTYCQYYDQCYGGGKHGKTYDILEGRGEKDSNAV